MDADRQLTSSDRRALRTEVVAEVARLDAQIASLTRSHADIVESAMLTSTDDEHDPEGTTIAFEREQVRALLGQAQEDRTAMSLAAGRIDELGYGVCESCGEFIGIERLLALPATMRCVDCAR